MFISYKNMPKIRQIQPIINNNNKTAKINSYNQVNNSDFQISREAAQAIKVQKLSFRGIKNTINTVTSEDVYTKFTEQANNYTLDEIKEVYNNITQRVQATGIDASPQEIKYTMGLLTQFATPNGMLKLAEKSYEMIDTAFFKGNSPDTTQFMRYLQTKKGMFPEEKYDTEKYQQEITNYFDDDEDGDYFAFQSHMKYVKENLKSEQYKKYNNLYYFADKKSLQYISAADRINLFSRNPIAICATGWDRGINFLDPKIGFEELEKNAAEVIVGTKEKYPNEEFNTALTKFLNEEAEAFAKDKGFKDVKFVSTIPVDKTVEFNDILNNLNIKIPSVKEIEIVTDSIAEVFENKNKVYKEKDDVVKSALLKYFYNTFNLFSTKSMTSDMRELYKKVEEALPDGKSMDDVKVILPDMDKSYVYIIRQFASLNNINPQTIQTGGKCANLNEIQRERYINTDSGFEYINPYKNDIILSIDDNALSGTSIFGYGGNSFGYDHYPINWDLNNTYIFGRIYATDTAEEKINELIAKNREKHPQCKDKFVCVKQIKDNLIQISYTKEEEEILGKALELYKTYWGVNGFQETKVNAIFPMTAPDNNSGLANFLALQFYSHKGFVKELTSKEDVREVTLQKIEEKRKKLNI